MSHQVKQKLQNCIKNISSWYKINLLKIYIDKTKVMLIGSKAKLKLLNVDDFILSYDDTPLDTLWTLMTSAAADVINHNGRKIGRFKPRWFCCVNMHISACTFV